MLSIALKIFLAFLIFWTLVFEVIVPLLQGGPVFPSFRKKEVPPETRAKHKKK